MARSESAVSRPATRAAWLTGLPATIVALLRRLRGDLPIVATIVGVTLVTSLIFAAIPLAFNQMADDGLRHAVGDAIPLLKNVQMTRAGRVSALGGIHESLDDEGAKFQSSLAPSIQSVIGQREFVADTPRYSIVDLPGQPAFPFPRFITMRYQSDIESRITLIDGRMPAATDETASVTLANGPQTLPVIELAISPETAKQLEVKLGDQLILLPADDDPLARGTPQSLLGNVAVRIVGLIDLNNPKDEFWYSFPLLDEPTIIETPDVLKIYAYALYAPDAYARILQATSPVPMNYMFRYFVDTARFNAGNLDTLARDVRKLDAQYSTTNFARPTEPSVSTGLSSIFARYLAQRDLTEAILSLASLGLLAVALTVIGLMAGLNAERRRESIAVVRSRGGSFGQLLSAQAAEALLLSVPIALVGYLLAVLLIGGRETALSPLLAFGIALATALLAVLASVPLARRNLQLLERGDMAVVARRLSPRRIAAEAFIVALAVAGVYLLRRRGLSGTSSTGGGGGFDVYLAAVPVLLGLATGVIVLRIFPLPVRLLAWAASLRRDLVPSLGLRRVSRQPSVTALPLLVLLLAVAVAVFSSVMLYSLEQGQIHTAWQTVGADYRVTSVVGGSLYRGVDLSGVRGVEASAAAYEQPGVTISSQTPVFGQLTFLAIDAPAYEQVVEGSPVDPRLPGALLLPPAGNDIGTPANPIPAVVSANWLSSQSPRPGDTFTAKIGAQDVTFVVSASRDTFPTLAHGQSFVIVPLASLQAMTPDRPVRPTELFLRAPASAAGDIEATLDQQSTSTLLDSRAEDYSEVHDAPLIAGVARGFRIGVVLAAAYSTLAIVIALALTARSRARDLAFLRTLGLSEGQSIGLVAVELGPPVAVALAVGIALGIGVARLVKPGLDLTAFTGPGVPVPLVVNVATIVYLAIGLLVIVALAVWAVGAAARRANLGSALRVGER